MNYTGTELENQQKIKVPVAEVGGRYATRHEGTEAGYDLSNSYVPDHLYLTIFNGSGAFSTCASLEN